VDAEGTKPSENLADRDIKKEGEDTSYNLHKHEKKNSQAHAKKQNTNSFSKTRRQREYLRKGLL
jgi:hypothetical protein